jgi:hypothetical protein
LGRPQQWPDTPGYQECGKNKGKKEKPEQKMKKDDRSNKKEEKKIHKTRKMNQHVNFGLDLRKSCDSGVQGCPGAFQGVGFGTALRPRPKPRVTPLIGTQARSFMHTATHALKIVLSMYVNPKKA